MTKFKNSLCVLNLVFFLTYFVILILSGFTSVNNNDSGNGKHYVLSSAHNQVNNDLLQLSEENETENDDDFEIQTVSLPHFIAQYQLKFYSSTGQIFQQHPTKSFARVYLSICNFRI